MVLLPDAGVFLEVHILLARSGALSGCLQRTNFLNPMNLGKLSSVR